MGVEIRPYNLDEGKQFEIDLKQIENLVTEKTRFLWIVNPSNPCGSVFSKSHMQEIILFCYRHNLFIVSDEVYWNESFSTHEFISFGHVESTVSVPVIVAGGLEKTFLVPGWSISWLVFFDKNQQLKDIRAACKITNEFLDGPCSFMQKALPILLDELTLNYTKNFMKIFETNHMYLHKEFTKIKGLTPIPAQGTFYIAVLIKLQEFPQFASDQLFLQALLDEENVWILNLSAFNGGVQGFRMMTCATDEIYSKLIPRISAFCKRHHK